VGKDRAAAFLAGLTAKMAAATAGDPADEATSLGPINSERALEELLEQIERAKAAGATIALGGKRVDRPGFYLEPTIITDIAEENPLYQEETFGPIAAIYTVETEEEALRVANATEFGLGATVFSADIEHAKDLANKLDVGMVFINSMCYSAPNVPFGGVKNSGYGRELSELGISEFVNKKLIRIVENA
jgi:succinate-semialdehyde dehydrogenase/glutarate-semialdehyde dehydrogenase